MLTKASKIKQYPLGKYCGQYFICLIWNTKRFLHALLIIFLKYGNPCERAKSWFFKQKNSNIFEGNTSYLWLHHSFFWLISKTISNPFFKFQHFIAPSLLFRESKEGIKFQKHAWSSMVSLCDLLSVFFLAKWFQNWWMDHKWEAKKRWKETSSWFVKFSHFNFCILFMIFFLSGTPLKS